MSVFAISDPHLPGGEKINKSMSIFGSRWNDHKNRIEKAWRSIVSDSDTVVLPGDISWAMSLEDAISDLAFLDSLPGKKIIGKGNHDFWWSSLSKMKDALSSAGISTIDFLQNNAFAVDDIVVCGTRGWFMDASSQADIFNTDHKKLSRREASRLENSILAALKLSGGDPSPVRVFLHFPAVLGYDTSPEIFEILEKYSVDKIYFGHIHDPSQKCSRFIFREKTFICIAADMIDFTPVLVR